VVRFLLPSLKAGAGLLATHSVITIEGLLATGQATLELGTAQLALGCAMPVLIRFYQPVSAV